MKVGVEITRHPGGMIEARGTYQVGPGRSEVVTADASDREGSHAHFQTHTARIDLLVWRRSATAHLTTAGGNSATAGLHW